MGIFLYSTFFFNVRVCVCICVCVCLCMYTVTLWNILWRRHQHPRTIWYGGLFFLASYIDLYECVYIYTDTFHQHPRNTQGRYDMVGIFFWHPILIFMSVCIYIRTLSINTQGTPKDDMIWWAFFFGILYWFIWVCVYIYWHFPSTPKEHPRTIWRVFFWQPAVICLSVCVYILTLSTTPQDDMTGIFLAFHIDLYVCVYMYVCVCIHTFHHASSLLQKRPVI